jgi:predicted peroxiredoxin
MERLEAGWVEVRNPFNALQVRRVSLKAVETEVLIFWTRDPRAVLAHAETLENRGYRFYVMTTLTAYPEILEPNMPAPETILAAMGELAKKIGPERTIWRYDPLFLCDCTDPAFHIRNFRRLSRALEGKVRRVIISVYDEYGGAGRRVAAREKDGSLKPLPHYTPDGVLLPGTRNLLSTLANMAREAGMDMYACAEAENLEELGIAAGACIDGALMMDLWGIKTGGKDKNQRRHCRCAPSVDIGRYGSCPAACLYCYARR